MNHKHNQMVSSETSQNWADTPQACGAVRADKPRRNWRNLGRKLATLGLSTALGGGLILGTILPSAASAQAQNLPGQNLAHQLAAKKPVTLSPLSAQSAAHKLAAQKLAGAETGDRSSSSNPSPQPTTATETAPSGSTPSHPASSGTTANETSTGSSSASSSASPQAEPSASSSPAASNPGETAPTATPSEQPKVRARRAVNENSDPVNKLWGDERKDTPTNIQNWTKESAENAHNIHPERGKYNTLKREYRVEQNNLGLSISAQYSHDGNYIIWHFKGWHTDSDNQQLYLRFKPGAGLEQQPDYPYATVAPLNFMDLVYGPDSATLDPTGKKSKGGYEKKDLFPGQDWLNASGTLYLWREFMKRGGKRPVPPNEQIDFEIRTKITDPNRDDYAMTASLVKSFYGTSGWSTARASIIQAGYIEGKSNTITISHQVDQDVYFKVYNQFDQELAPTGAEGHGQLVPVADGAGRTFRTNQRGIYTIGQAPRFDADGVRQQYRLKAVDSSGKPLQDTGNLKLIPLNQDGDMWTFRDQAKDKDRTDYYRDGAALFRDPYGEADTLYGRWRKDDHEVTVKGQYTKDGKYILWTVQTKKTGGNSDLTIYPQFSKGLELIKHFPGEDHQDSIGTGDYLKPNEGTEGEWSQNGYWYAKGAKDGKLYTHTFVTKITDPNLTEYKARFKTQYGYYAPDRVEWTNVSVEGLRFSPIVDEVKIWPTTYGEERDLASTGIYANDLPKMQVEVFNEDTKTLVEVLDYDEDTRTYKVGRTLPRFDDKGNKIMYSLRVKTDGLKVERNGVKVNKYRAEVLSRDEYGGHWGITFVRTDQKEDWGVTSVEPISFSYKSPAEMKKLEPRFLDGFDGHYGWLEGTYAVPEDAHAGDRFTLTIPQVANLKVPQDFDVFTLGPNGIKEIIAKAEMDPVTNVVTFHLTDYVETHKHIRGKFRIGPLINSIFDATKNGTQPVQYTSRYYPAGQKDATKERTLDSTYTMTYDDSKASDNFFSDPRSDLIIKEEIGETDNTIIYGLHVDRRANKIQHTVSIADELGDEKTTPYSWAKWTNRVTDQAVPTTNPKEFIRVYQVPPTAGDHYTVNRSVLDDPANLIWPQSGGGSAPGWEVTPSVNGRKFNLTVRRPSGAKIGSLLVLTSVKKIPFDGETPQSNKAIVLNRSHGVTRYPTFGEGEGLGVALQDDTSRIRVRKVSTANPHAKLPKAHFRLYRKGAYQPATPSVGLLATGETNEEGILQFRGIYERGYYDLVEDVPPVGYVIRDAALGKAGREQRYTIWVEGSNRLNSFTVANDPIGQITLVKGNFNKYRQNVVDGALPPFEKPDAPMIPEEVLAEQAGRNLDEKTFEAWHKQYLEGKFERLPGAQYQLYYVVKAKDGTIREIKKGSPKTTGVDGTVTWTKADGVDREGTYFVEEIKAPEGFSLPDNPISFSKDPDNPMTATGPGSVWQTRRVYFRMRNLGSAAEPKLVAPVQYAHNDHPSQEPYFVSLGDRVWYDDDKDGLQGVNENDRNVPDTLVELYDETGTQKIAETRTDKQGLYNFRGLTEGTKYQLKFSLPSGVAGTYQFTKQDVTVAGVDTEADDSDVNAAGWTGVVTAYRRLGKMRPHEDLDNPNVDAGIQAQDAPKQRVHLTKLGFDTKQPIEGVEFELYRDLGAAPLPKGIVKITQADQKGNAQWVTTDLEVGVTYTLREVKAPRGYQLLPLPISFQVDKNGAVKLMDPQTASALVTVADYQNQDHAQLNKAQNLLQVHDVPIGHLPAAGGRTPFLPVLLGLGLILLVGYCGFRWWRQ